MDIAYFGHGPVGEQCRQVLIDLGFNIVEPSKADFWMSVHWPEIFTEFPKGGILNLHNGYLPWGRGADACMWAIAEHAPHGVTLHWVDKGIDTGDIFRQKRVYIEDNDTTDTLYKRTAEEEVKLFRSAMWDFLHGKRFRVKQNPGGSYHNKKDRERLIRALTTSDMTVVRRGEA